MKAELSINCTGPNYSIHYDTGYYDDDYYNFDYYSYDDNKGLTEYISLGLICSDQTCVSCIINEYSHFSQPLVLVTKLHMHGI